MNRKHTIVIAVMVNAGLLLVLFMAALTTQEEILQSSPIVESSSRAFRRESVDSPSPLFTEISDQALRGEPAPAETALVKSPESPPALHPLPPRAAEPAPFEIAKEPTHVPAGPKAEIAAPSLPLPDASGLIEIIVKKGDSLDKLAKEYHTSVSELIKINRLPSSFLRVGQVLKVPLSRKNPSAQKPASLAAKEEEAISYYTVKVGDNPWTIAMKHHMKVEELLRLNDLDEQKAKKLKPGDRLRTKYTPGH